jgi:putative aldouronate transport system permease protein
MFARIAYTFCGLFALIGLLPFYLVLVGSFTKESTILTAGFRFFITARDFSLAAYQLAFKTPQTLLRAYTVTTFVTGVGTAGAVFLAAMTGYVLARPDFPWRNPISFFFFFTTLFNGGLVPWYLLCSKFLQFNKRNWTKPS